MSGLTDEYNKFKALHEHYPVGVCSLAGFEETEEAYKSIARPYSLVYRGEPREYARPLEPSIRREFKRFTPMTSPDGAITLLITKEEVEEVQKIQKVTEPNGFSDSSVGWLPFTQHHGGLTRLLDFTRLPLVALFFACWSQSKGVDPGSDGWVFCVPEGSARWQTVGHEEVEKRHGYEQGVPSTYCELFEPWALSDTHENLPHLLDLLNYRDYHLNVRMKAQSGVFVWWTPINSEFPHDKRFPILIQGMAKPRILKKLDARGVRPERLFPDPEGKQMQSDLDAELEKY